MDVVPLALRTQMKITYTVELIPCFNIYILHEHKVNTIQSAWQERASEEFLANY